MRLRGFTLIELMVVVGIIATLAAIAIPNFFESQTRARVARAKADMRSVDTALNAYIVDHNVPPVLGYPVSGSGTDTYGGLALVSILSTPMAYLSNARLIDPFLPVPKDYAGDKVENDPLFGYTVAQSLGYVNIRAKREADNMLEKSSTNFALVSCGPDKVCGPVPDPDGPAGLGLYAGSSLKTPEMQNFYSRGYYDPTNGTYSVGDLLRYQGINPK